MALPEKGDRVKIWPAPDRVRVQDGPRPIDALGGGRALADQGREVIWSEFHLEQFRAGDILLHSPVPAAAPTTKTPKAAKE